MTIEDIHWALVSKNMIHLRSITPPLRPSPGQSIKFPKGRKNGVARRNLQRALTTDNKDDGSATPKAPFVAPTEYEIRWDRAQVKEYLDKWDSKGYLRLRPEKLKWSPFLLARTNKTEAAEAPSTEEAPAESQEDLTQKVIRDLFADEDDVNIVNVSRVNGGDDRADALPEEPVAAADEEEDMAQLEKDLVLAQELASSAKRRLRTRSTTNGHAASTPSRSPLPVTGKRKVTESPPTTRHTRSKSNRNNANGTDAADNVAMDEALAAKLAREEARPSRQLRSRRDTSRMHSGTPTTNNIRVSPRKRQRLADSSPEPQPSRTSSPEHEPIVENGMAPNGAGSRLSSSHSPTKVNGAVETSVSAEPASTTAEVVDAMKYEDFGTPLTGLTGLTSRHSVPSDDTVAADGHVNGKDDIPAAGVNGAPGHDPEKGIGADVDDDEDPDAEGELDAEGEPDIDLE